MGRHFKNNSRSIQENLADAKVSARQQCVYELEALSELRNLGYNNQRYAISYW